MSLVKIERIISVSSEDPAFPAENLLKTNYSDKKWKCKHQGEKQVSVVLQLGEAVIINAIDIGNYGSAFVEVFVGKSSNPDDFKVLVVASSLMTLQEAKLGENMSNVRFFKEDSLVKPVSLEKWDRIKLVCSQPYNKFIQYGLSFVVVHSKNVAASEIKVPALGKFILKPKDDSDNISTGSLFAKRKESSVDELKGAAAIRAASTSGIINKKKPSKLIALDAASDQEEDDNSYGKMSEVNNSVPETNSTSVLRRDSTKKQRDKPKTPKRKPDILSNGPPAQGSSSTLQNGQGSKRTIQDKDIVKKKIIPNKRREKPFNKLMEDVVFAISGFVNPYRSDLRNKAIAMGAKYKSDWDSTCTHLLCAFPNTPKFNQVLGHGKIITKAWIENCYSRRMRLPWRRFALHRPDQNLPESEEEVFEYVPCPPSPIDNRRRLSPGPDSSGEDTEEEIERVRMLQNKKQKEDSELNNISEDLVNDIESSNVNNNYEKELSNTATESKELRKKVAKSENSEMLFSPNKTKKKMFHKNNQKKSRDESISSEEKTKHEELLVYKENGLEDIQTMEEENGIVQKIDNEPGPSRKFCNTDVYEMDTDVEFGMNESIQYDLPPLKVFYEGIIFFIGKDIPDEERKKLERYIIAHKGSITEKSNSSVEFIISRSPLEIEMVKKVCRTAIAVKPDWVWMCHDQNYLPPPSKYEIN